MKFTNPSENCDLCPRLAGFRCKNRHAFPDKHNAPVPSFGSLGAALLIVGLAPGLKGANFTGRPFTGDYAGDLLYEALLKFKLATGVYEAVADDKLSLVNCRITNAVRCVPPENKPTGQETSQCRPFLINEITDMTRLTRILALGKISHDAILRTFDKKLAAHPFVHGEIHELGNGLTLIDSYHCSRYNVNTGRLTKAMFFEIFEKNIMPGLAAK